MRDSLSHPITIASVRPALGMGLIGLTFCPGKKQANAFTGAWNRDLGLDLDRIASWGTVALVTLVEAHELEALKVQALGREVRSRHMEWLHLPIPDISVPCSKFEEEWREIGEGLRARLRSGFSIVVHCKGGLGRAGTVAARLLVELGWEARKAIDAVREARPSALETAAQVKHVLSIKPILEPEPGCSPESIRDRAMGALLGLAVGDAVGTTLEFSARDSVVPVDDMVGGGPFRLKKGQWTDDTAMALALADSLIEHGRVDPKDLMRRFVRWRDEGAYSCTGTCFDIGGTVSAALNRFKQTGEPLAGSTNVHSAGNGSLMRLAPVALRFWSDRSALKQAAALQSRTTHGAAEAVDACIGFAEMLADAIEGHPRSSVLRVRSGSYTKEVAEVLAGSWRGKSRARVHSSGYVVHSLEAAIWSVARTSDYRSAVLTAANLGGDADTTAAIAGQLAGAIYGVSGIPAEWLEVVAWRAQLQEWGEALVGHRSA